VKGRIDEHFGKQLWTLLVKIINRGTLGKEIEENKRILLEL